MEIGATKAVQDRLKTTKIAESKGASLVFCCTGCELEAGKESERESVRRPAIR